MSPSHKKIPVWCLAAALCVAGGASALWPAVGGAGAPTSSAREKSLLRQLERLNQVPAAELNDRADPGFSIIRTIYDQDGPEFLTLRRILSQQPQIRASLNPSAKAVVAGIISQRWDTFMISGNLWLGALQSPNLELRSKARRKLVIFIQPAHIPELINLLPQPGPNVPAYEILQEVTGQTLDPSIKSWRAWWARTHGRVDLVGHLLNDTRRQIAQRPISPLDADRLWYAPGHLSDTRAKPDERPAAEQALVNSWNDWVHQDVKRYVNDWSAAKPVIDRVTHQPDLRVNKLLEALCADPGYGDYTSVVLAWRQSLASLPVLQAAYERMPTVGRALARGALGDKTALKDLLRLIEKNPEPLSTALMDDETRSYAEFLHTVGSLPAEQAFELLSHHAFGLASASTRSEKKKALKKAEAWLHENESSLSLDKRRGYYVNAAP